MATELLLDKVGGRLVPATAADAEALDKLPSGRAFRCVVTRPRSDAAHRFYWALLSKVVDATGLWPTAEVLNDALKLELGFVRPVLTSAGVLHLVPRSTSYAEMEGTEFKAFMDRAIAHLCAEVLGGMEPGELRAEVEAMLTPAPVRRAA